MDRQTQCSRMLGYMREHGSITVRQAVTLLGINSPTRRITDLKRMGYEIESETVSDGRTRWSVYRLAGDAE